jgi:hypothetical protein
MMVKASIVIFLSHSVGSPANQIPLANHEIRVYLQNSASILFHFDDTNNLK